MTPDPPRMPRIELTLVGGAAWRWNPLTLHRAVVVPTGTAVYARSGTCRVVRETPEEIYAAVAAVTPEFGGRTRFLARVRERLPASS